MRFSFLQGFNQGLDSMLRAQARTFDTQNQVATGKRVNTPAADPVASARIVQISQEQSQVNQFINNADMASARLELEETQLESMTSMLARIRELTVQAGNGIMTKSDRTMLAAEMRTRLDQLLDLANTRNTSGEYIFAGFKGGDQPFVQAPNGEFQYNGDDGQRFVNIAVSTKVPINDSGKDIFVDIASSDTTFTAATVSGSGFISDAWVADLEGYIPDANFPPNFQIEFDATGSTYTVRDLGATPPADVVVTGVPYQPGEPINLSLGNDPTDTGTGRISVLIDNPGANDVYSVNNPPKQNVMETIRKLADGLENFSDSPTDRERLRHLVSDSLSNVTNAEENLAQVRAKIGARHNTIEALRSLQEGVGVVNQEILSEIRDLDYAEAVSRLSMETFMLEAAQQSFAKVSNLSLFNYLR